MALRLTHVIIGATPQQESEWKLCCLVARTPCPVQLTDRRLLPKASAPTTRSTGAGAGARVRPWPPPTRCPSPSLRSGCTSCCNRSRDRLRCEPQRMRGTLATCRLSSNSVDGPPCRGRGALSVQLQKILIPIQTPGWGTPQIGKKLSFYRTSWESRT